MYQYVSSYVSRQASCELSYVERVDRFVGKPCRIHRERIETDDRRCECVLCSSRSATIYQGERRVAKVNAPCFRRLLDSAKAALQPGSGHLNGLSPVCVPVRGRSQTLSTSEEGKVMEAHAYGSSRPMRERTPCHILCSCRGALLYGYDDAEPMSSLRQRPCYISSRYEVYRLLRRQLNPSE